MQQVVVIMACNKCEAPCPLFCVEEFFDKTCKAWAKWHMKNTTRNISYRMILITNAVLFRLEIPAQNKTAWIHMQLCDKHTKRVLLPIDLISILLRFYWNPLINTYQCLCAIGPLSLGKTGLIISVNLARQYNRNIIRKEQVNWTLHTPHCRNKPSGKWLKQLTKLRCYWLSWKNFGKYNLTITCFSLPC